MRLKTIERTFQAGYRRDGSRVLVSNPAYRSRRVWQVSHGPVWDRSRDWFTTKRAALAFAVKGARKVNEWEDIYLCAYPLNGAQWERGKLIGHKQAERRKICA